jgi:hypothetical protein
MVAIFVVLGVRAAPAGAAPFAGSVLAFGLAPRALVTALLLTGAVFAVTGFFLLKFLFVLSVFGGGASPPVTHINHSTAAVKQGKSTRTLV